MEKQAVVLGDGTDCDVIALAEDQLEAAVQVFYVRGGRVRGQRGWVLEKVEEVTTAGLVEQFLGQVYGGHRRPRRGGANARHPARGPGAGAAAGRADDDRSGWPSAAAVPSSLRVPQRGDKKALAETVARNAKEALALHKTRRASDLTTRSRALHEIQERAGPGRRAAADRVLRRVQPAGHARRRVHGRLRGRPGAQERVPPVRRSRGTDGSDDISAIREVITRRFRRYLAEREETGELRHAGRPGARGARRVRARTRTCRRRREPPRASSPTRRTWSSSTVARAQAQAAAAALAELGIDDVAVCGLAKRLEEVWLPAEEYPLILSRTSEGLYLLQRVRDEAHRFAITYHRHKRGKAATVSALDDIPGLGPARRAALLKHFGSVRAVSAGLARADRGSLRYRPQACRDHNGLAAGGFNCEFNSGFSGGKRCWT